MKNPFKNIFSRKSSAFDGLKNLLNKALYQFTGDIGYMIPDKIESYVNDGYRSNIHVYSVTTAIANRTTGFQLQHFDGEREIANSKTLALLSRPNPMQSWDDFIKAGALWYMITGNCYVYSLAPDSGLNKDVPKELWLLPAHVVRIIGGGIDRPITGYRVELGAGVYKEIPADQIIHWKDFNPNYDTNGSQLYGQSPLAAGLLTIQASNEGYKALTKAYQNGAPAGILTGTENKDLEYTPEQIEAINTRWAKKYGSVDNYMKIIFSRNPMQWIQMGYSVVDMNIIGLMEYTLQDVCNLYHVPIHLFASKNAALNNYRESRKAIYTDAVIPLMDQFMSLINTFLVPRMGEIGLIKYDTSQITELNSDIAELMTVIQNAYFLTGNEKREKMGLQPLADPMMDAILYPSNLLPGVELVNMDGNDLSL